MPPKHRPPAEKPWVKSLALSPDEALQRLSSIAGGLTPSQIEERLRSVGRNQVTHQARHTILGELVGRSVYPLNVLLLSLATASYFLGDQRAALDQLGAAFYITAEAG
jgi:P-type Mg2+ transporter